MKNTILVVEDELALQEVVCKKLSVSGFNCLSARTVDQAFGYLTDGATVSAIWLDHYLLGGENGLDFVVKIKENKKFENVPIFVVSNTASHDKVQSYLELGVKKYFTKSNYRLDEIIKDIKEVIDKEKNE